MNQDNKKERKSKGLVKAGMHTVLLPGVPAGLLFLLPVTPFSWEAKASEEDGAPQEAAALSSMSGLCAFWSLYGGDGYTDTS